jgi:hypothetical protein
MRAILAGLSAVLVLTLTACIGDPKVDDDEARLRVTGDYEAPPAWMNSPISIGGYALFVAITGPRPAGGELKVDGFETTLPPGHYRIEIVTRPLSDAIVIDATSGRATRELGPVSARCSADVELHAWSFAVVHYTAVGGELCRLTVQA